MTSSSKKCQAVNDRSRRSRLQHVENKTKMYLWGCGETKFTVPTDSSVPGTVMECNTPSLQHLSSSQYSSLTANALIMGFRQKLSTSLPHTHTQARTRPRRYQKQQQTFHWDTLHKAVVSNSNPTVALWMEKKKSAASGYHVIFPPSSVCLPRVFANVLLELIKGCRERYFRGWVRGSGVEGS